MSKRVCILRWGAYGDAVIMTPLLSLYKNDGWHVTVNVNKRCEEVLRHNPNIDKFVIYEDNTVPNDKLEEYWAEIAKQYDKFVNLSESIEGTLLKCKGRPDYELSYDKIRKTCDINYYDKTLEIGGYGNESGLNGELFFSQFEESETMSRLSKDIGKFKILWSLAGSSFHKAYPYAEYVAIAFLNKHPDAMIYTVGDELAGLLEWQHPRTRNLCGKLGIRKTFNMTKHCDLVIAPETGVLNAAGCYDTAKIALLSHSSENNLTKYFKNCFNIRANIPCQPCHKMHYDLGSCPIDPVTAGTACMAKIEPDRVFGAMEKVYQDWRNDGLYDRTGKQRVLCA